MLDIGGDRFVDRHGRQVLLRGVNLGGDCKIPAGIAGTHLPDDFSDHRTVSFVGRPFPLAEADAHLDRIRRWGFNTLRLLTTWEAVAHAGPGERDEAYLDYLREVCRRAAARGLFVFIDFHQDVWSRMTGGDGAPGWTFDLVGLDLTRFHAADAAHLMQPRYDPAIGGRQDAYPQMSWSRNYRMPANGIMWTLFFGARTFLPGFKIGGESVQDLLQGDYLGALHAVAERVADIPEVIGFDTLNEPSTGFIGEPLDRRHEVRDAAHPEPVRAGWAMSALDMLRLASGEAIDLPVYAFTAERLNIERIGSKVANPDRIPIWRPDVRCPFAAAGLYEGDRALEPDHFRKVDGRTIDADRDHMLPFFHAVAETMRGVRPDWLLFAELNPYKTGMGHKFPAGMPPRTVNASHWYDLYALVTKTYPDEVAAGAPEWYAQQLAVVKAAADTLGPEGAPTLIGEFGLPFDLDEGAAYAAWAAGDRGPGPWARHVRALTNMYDTLDRLLLSATQWNYTASNRNDAAVGDAWNQEDLSIYSADQATGDNDPDSGGRAVAGFARPYARAVQGRLIEQHFDAAACRFRIVFDADPAIDAPTEIVVPPARFPGRIAVTAPGCERLADPAPGVIALRAVDTGRRQIEVVAAEKAG
ncbi:cellulase family glycosylhydrolase [Sphingomonas sp. DT-204]|uniref:cellulase family glycosylhydrolase n=1 Tax=Sphingomonas sp. DT-204 TaxID=3396166 RepID=UPI003F1D177A